MDNDKVAKFKRFVGFEHTTDHLTRKQLYEDHGVKIVNIGGKRNKSVYGVAECNELPEAYMDSFKIYTMYDDDPTEYYVECSLHCGGLHEFRFTSKMLEKE